MLLLISAIAPSLALLYYIYLRDKYEKEPRKLLFKVFFLGSLAVIPIVIIELKLDLFDMTTNTLIAAGYTAFVVAGLVEESFKYLVFWLFIWKNKNFNERYDGIVYSVFISLGFATTENIGYVMLSGFHTAFIRSLTAVPAHALFGIIMGYYFGKARFEQGRNCSGNLFYAWIIPITLHGIYDFILFSQRTTLLIIFIPYMLYLWKRGLNHVDELSECTHFSLKKQNNKE